MRVNDDGVSRNSKIVPFKAARATGADHTLIVDPTLDQQDRKCWYYRTRETWTKTAL